MFECSSNLALYGATSHLTAFRALLVRHRRDIDWQKETAALIGQTWNRLATVDDDLLLRIDQRRADWRSAEKCHKLTGVAGCPHPEKCPLLTGYEEAGQVKKCPLLTGSAKSGQVGKSNNSTGSEESGQVEKCPKLTGVSEPDANRETLPAESEKCPLLTGSAEVLSEGKMSTINPLNIVLIPDIASSQTVAQNAGLSAIRGTPPEGSAGGDVLDDEECSTAGERAGESSSSSSSCFSSPSAQLDSSAGPPAGVASSSITLRSSTSPQGAVRPTASMMKADAALLAKAQEDRRRYATGSQEDDVERAAHNLRNDQSNPRNNLARRLRRLLDVPAGRPLLLFAPAEIVRLTPDQRAALDHWQGTPYEVRL